MRLALRLIVALALLAGPAASAAQAVTLKDVIDLKKAGISDAVVVALIDSDATVFQLTASDVRTLRDAGFSDSLIVSILNTAVKSREQMAAQAQAQAAQQLWAAQQQQQPVSNLPPDQSSSPVYAEPTVPAGFFVSTPYPAPRYVRQQTPVYVPVPVYVTGPVGRPARDQAPKAEPVYWGFGGQRRPDAWKEPGGGR